MQNFQWQNYFFVIEVKSYKKFAVFNNKYLKIYGCKFYDYGSLWKPKNWKTKWNYWNTNNWNTNQYFIPSVIAMVLCYLFEKIIPGKLIGSGKLPVKSFNVQLNLRR